MQFKDYHPAINFCFFAVAVTAAVFLKHPVFLAVSWVCSFAYSVKLGGKKALILDLCLILLAVLFCLWYSFYHHFGVTELKRNFIGNRLTLESMIYGLTVGLVIAAVIMWMCCVWKIFTADKVVYLFGRISPRLSLFLALLLRGIPRIADMGRKINTAQKGLGRGLDQGNLLQRIKNLFRLLSILITWSIESFLVSSDSMRCRGVTLRGRTAFSIYRFDNRDRSFILVLFSLFTVVTCGLLLDQGKILFDPEIVINRITPLSFVFYGAYLALCLLPMVMEIAAERRFRLLQEQRTESV